MKRVQRERTGSKNELQRAKSTFVVVVATPPLTVGHAPAAFRSVIRVWKRTCGVSPVAEPIGSALIVERFGHFDILINPLNHQLD